MSLYLAAYDIADDTRRRRIAAVLERLGVRVQESVFELRLEPEDLPELRADLGAILHPSDSFDLYPVDARPGRQRLRWQRSPDDDFPTLIID